MKKLMTFVVGIFFCLNVNAQWDYGIRIGFGIDLCKAEKNLIRKENFNQLASLDFMEKTNTYTAGLFVQRNFDYAFFQLGIDVSKNSIEYMMHNEISDNVNEISIQEEYLNIDFSAIVGGKFKHIYFGAGPLFSRHLNAEYEMPLIENLSHYKKKVSASSQMLFGLKLNHVILEWRYIRSFSKFGDQYSFNNSLRKTASQRANELRFTIGLSF